MHHPEVLAVPFAMLADYYLTLYGSALSSKKYGRHLRSEHYELNPRWQLTVTRRQWLNPRHLFLVGAVTFLLVLFDAMIGRYPEFTKFLHFFVGMILTTFLCLIGRHTCNILLFRYVARHPASLSGEARFSHELSLAISQYQILMVAIPLAAAVAANPTDFMIGALASQVVLLYAHLVWGAKYRKANRDRVRDIEPDNRDGLPSVEPEF